LSNYLTANGRAGEYERHLNEVEQVVTSTPGRDITDDIGLCDFLSVFAGTFRKMYPAAGAFSHLFHPHIHDFHAVVMDIMEYEFYRFLRQFFAPQFT
jgi:hypothetical protein